MTPFGVVLVWKYDHFLVCSYMSENYAMIMNDYKINLYSDVKKQLYMWLAEYHNSASNTRHVDYLCVNFS